ncbi:23282_t:CDS:2, partial [Gigaspora rosea]
QLLDAAQQELLWRKIQRELDVNMGTRQRINLELCEVVNSLKDEEEEEVSDGKEEPTTDENNDQLGNDEADNTSVMVFELMRTRCRRRLVFVEICVDNGYEYYLYLHPTLGMHYTARRLNLCGAVYHLEFITFSLIANDPMDLITL